MDKSPIPCGEDETYDAFLSLDASDRERLGAAVQRILTARKNASASIIISAIPGFGETDVIDAAACATASEMPVRDCWIGEKDVQADGGSAVYGYCP